MKREIWIVGLLGIEFLANAQVRTSLPIPGTPRGDLATELLQSRAYCVGLIEGLDNVERRFPELSVDVLAARSAWMASPFSGGCRTIESGILSSPDGKRNLEVLDKKVLDETRKRLKLDSREEALAFLDLVAKRSKGEIEVDLVRGNLLWQHKPYQENPEKEYLAGFNLPAVISTESGENVRFKIPMSWKQEEEENPALMGFRNCYGHGNVWMTVMAQPASDDDGNPMLGAEMFANCTEPSLRTAWSSLGIELLSFQKTKVNNMPAIIATRRQTHEQLGERATRASEMIRVFHGDLVINFQINTLGPEGQALAEERIKKNSALFKGIVASFAPSE
jgi:hypothetical protein